MFKKVLKILKVEFFFLSKTQDQVGEGKHSKNEQKMKTPH